MEKLYNKNILEKFIIIQPLIDIITSIMMNSFSISFSVGMVLRFLFLAYALVYLLNNKNNKVIIYVLLLFVYSIINLIGHSFNINNFNIFAHIALMLKMVYFPIVLLFWYIYLKNNDNLNGKVFSYISIIVGLSLISSILTKTTYCTYVLYDPCIERGLLGWFNSANEYGLILVLLLIFNLMNYNKKFSFINLISIIFIVLFLVMMGTKTGYVGSIVLLLVYIFYYLVSLFKTKNNPYKVVPIILIVASVIGLTSYLPIKKNLELIKDSTVTQVIDKMDEDKKNEITSIKQTTTKKEIKKTKTLKVEKTTTTRYAKKYEYVVINDKETLDKINEQVKSNLVFNGREEFVKVNKEIFKNTNTFNKLFGLTDQGKKYNGEEFNFITERDFHDLLYRFGIIGFILDLMLPISILIGIIINIFKNFKLVINDTVFLSGVGIGLIIIISYMAGHALFSPAVSIYLAYMIAYLTKEVQQ